MTVSFVNVRIIDNCLIFDEVTGKFHRVNETAAFIIDCLKKKIHITEIISSYADMFDVPITTAARDVELFLNDILVDGKHA